MATVEKSVLVHFSAHQMYELVKNVEQYPQFLPWCGAAGVEEIEAENVQRAFVEIAFKGFRQRFTTRNTLNTDQQILISLLNGPFTHLDGTWQFKALTPEASKVHFKLDYEFSSKVLEQLVGPVFSSVANSLVDAFVKRAERLYDQGAAS